MSGEDGGEVTQIREDVRRIRKGQEPRPGADGEAPVSSGWRLGGLLRQQREDQRQPRQEQVPEQKDVTDIARPEKPPGYQTHADRRSKGQGQHGHGRFAPRGNSPQFHANTNESTLVETIIILYLSIPSTALLS